MLISTGPVARAGEVLYFADIFDPTFDDGTIRRVNTDGTGLQALVTVGGGLRGMVPKPDSDWIFWSNVETRTIARAHLDGSDTETIIDSELSFPNALTLDRTADRLFWGDQSAQRIGHANLDGSGTVRWLDTPFHAGLVVDDVHEMLYWTAQDGPTSGMIMRAGLDGGSAEVVVADVGKPAHLAVDSTGEKVYWTDYVNDVVCRADLDGTDVETLFQVGENRNPGAITLDPAGGKVYWAQDSSMNRHEIMSMDLDGSDSRIVAGPFGLINALCFVPEPTTFLSLILTLAWIRGTSRCSHGWRRWGLS